MNTDCIAVIPSIHGASRLLPTIDLPRKNILIVDQGVNHGIEKAFAMGVKYVLVIDPNVIFETHVATQLVARANKEKALGILAPAKIIEEGTSRQRMSRAYWDLQHVQFLRDLTVYPDVELLESDFCEFTCVLISRSVFEQVGLPDNGDADFCFRAAMAGFRCAYDQTALITHLVYRNNLKGRDFGQEAAQIFAFGANCIAREQDVSENQKDAAKLTPLKTDSSGCFGIKTDSSGCFGINSPQTSAYRDSFAQSHLKYAMRGFYNSPKVISSFQITNSYLNLYLHRYGLISQNRDNPLFSYLGHPLHGSGDYFLTVWETSKLPSAWLEECKKYRQIFVPSRWNAQVFKEAGFSNVSVIPLGVDPDIFTPWGPKISFPWEQSILCVAMNQHRKALEVTLRMWNEIRARHPGTFLVLYGKGIKPFQFLKTCDVSLCLGEFKANIDTAGQIALLQPAFEKFVHSSSLATLYRSANFYLLNSRSEGFGLPVAEAMACGTCCIIPNYGATAEFIQEKNCLSFIGHPIPANYTDMGFSDVGNWWEPDFADLCNAVESALCLSSKERAVMGELGRQSILTHYTWRHTAIAFYKELSLLQNPTSKRFRAKDRALKKSGGWHKQAAHFTGLAGMKLHHLSIILERQGFRKTGLAIIKRLLKPLLPLK